VKPVLSEEKGLLHFSPELPPEKGYLPQEAEKCLTEKRESLCREGPASEGEALTTWPTLKRAAMPLEEVFHMQRSLSFGPTGGLPS